MISELKDDEILEFLMNSDLEGDYSPEELKYLIFKWRYFYRLLYGRSDRTKIDFEGRIRQLEDQIKISENNINLVKIEAAIKQDEIDSMKSRKLTWKERWSGKIILKNEDK
jgi:hypothetical protein